MNYSAETFEFDSTPPRESNSINNGELVRCLVLDFGHPTSYLKALAEENKTAKGQADSLGFDYEEKKPSFKDGGIMAKVAVVYRIDNKQPVFGTAKTPVQPSYSCYSQITMLPPSVIYEKGWSSFTKGLMNVKKDGSFVIGGILPSAFPAIDWNTKQPDPAKEKERKSKWQEILEAYQEMTEEQAHLWLLRRLAQRFLFVSETSEHHSLLKPTTGLVFEARVRKKDGSFMFDFERFQWDKETKQYVIYGNPFAYIDQESIEIATNIIAEREVQALQREHAKAQKEEEYDDIPF